MRVRWIGLAALCAATATCGTLLSSKLDQELNDKYGKPNPATFDQRPAPAPGAVSYERQIRPLFERRCVVCHGCYDAPCQLKMESWDGIARGASKEPVYKAPDARGRAHPAVPGRRLHVGLARARLLPGAERARPVPRREPRGQPAVSAAGAEAPAPDPSRWLAAVKLQAGARHRTKMPPAGRAAGVREASAAVGDALRNAGDRRRRVRADRTVAGRRRTGGADPAVAGGGGGPGPDLGSVLQRRLAETATGLALPVRAPVPGAPALRGRFRAAVLPPGALADAARPAHRPHRHPAAL